MVKRAAGAGELARAEEKGVKIPRALLTVEGLTAAGIWGTLASARPRVHAQLVELLAIVGALWQGGEQPLTGGYAALRALLGIPERTLRHWIPALMDCGALLVDAPYYEHPDDAKRPPGRRYSSRALLLSPGLALRMALPPSESARRPLASVKLPPQRQPPCLFSSDVHPSGSLGGNEKPKETRPPATLQQVAATVAATLALAPAERAAARNAKSMDTEGEGKEGRALRSAPLATRSSAYTPSGEAEGRSEIARGAGWRRDEESRPIRDPFLLELARRQGIKLDEDA